MNTCKMKRRIAAVLCAVMCYGTAAPAAAEAVLLIPGAGSIVQANGSENGGIAQLIMPETTPQAKPTPTPTPEAEQEELKPTATPKAKKKAKAKATATPKAKKNKNKKKNAKQTATAEPVIKEIDPALLIREPEQPAAEEPEKLELVEMKASISVDHATGEISVKITQANEGVDIGVYVDGLEDVVMIRKGGTAKFTVTQSGTYNIGAEYDHEDLLGYVFEGTATVNLEAAQEEPQVQEEITGVTLSEVVRASALDKEDGRIAGKVTFTGLRNVVVVLNDSEGKDLEFITLAASEDGSAVTRSFALENLASGKYTIEFYFKGDGTSGKPPVKKVTADVTFESKPEEKPEFIQIEATVSVNDADGKFTVTVTKATAGEQMIAYVDGLGSQDQALYKGESATFTVPAAGDYALEIDYLNSENSSCAFAKTVKVNGSGEVEKPHSRIEDVDIDITACSDGESDGAIAGKVTFTGAQSVIVRLYEASTQVGKKTLASGDTFSFDGLDAGEYALHIYFEGSDVPAYSAGPYVPKAAAKAKKIAAAATVTGSRIDVTVSEASPIPVTVSLLKDGSIVKTADIAAGVGSVSFENLQAGTYSVSINYNPAQDGVSATVKKDLVVEEEKAEAIVITGVTGGENMLTVTGTAQKNTQVMITTKPAAAATVYAMTNAKGKFTAEVSCAAGTYTKVTVQYSGDTDSAVSVSGEFVVTAPQDKPEITIDPIDASSITAVAKTTPGVVVKIKTDDYTATVTADEEGIVRFSLPHTYVKGTKIKFTVYYGKDNAESFTKTVTVKTAVYEGRLKKGDKGDAVKRLTTRLKELGYPVSITNKYNDQVERAVRLFQEANGLEVDGEAGRSTQEKLFSVSAIRYGEKRYPTLVRGDRGLTLIYTLQQRLKDLGYYTIKVDGIFGSATQRAVRDFQKINGLTVTGKADDATQRLLYSSKAKPAYGVIHGDYRTLSRSSKYQSAVVPLQRRLKALGYYSGSIDGYFGSQTYRAVREFQRRNGIDRTGVADPYTQQILYSSKAVPASGSSSGGGSSDSTGYRLLYWGCTGSAVKRLQNALINAGYRSIVRTADGIYGRWTYDAVRAYQRDHGLTVDGIAGRKTQNSLYGTNY